VSLTEEPKVPKTGRREVPHESKELYRLPAERSTDMISKHTPWGVYKATKGGSSLQLQGKSGWHPVILGTSRRS
jgi:hypothetical protein